MKADTVFSFPVWRKIGRTLTDWRIFGALFVITVVVSLLLSLSAADTARLTAQENRRRFTAQIRETEVIAHSQCFRVNDVRRRIRSYMAEAVRLAFESPLTPAPPFTSEQRAALDALATTISDAGASILPFVDCDRAAPLPPNMTADEKAQLPEPEPIVIPGDP